MPDLVLYEVVDRVALITVNDPDRRNAVTDAMSQQLRAAVEAAEAEAARGRGHRRGQGVLRGSRPVRARRRRQGRARTDLCRLHGRRPLHPADHRRGQRRRGRRGPQPGAGRRRPHRRTRTRCSTRASRNSASIRAAAPPGCCSARSDRRSPARRCCSACASTPKPPCATDWPCTVAEDPVAAALELAAGPASAPRDVVLATKASMRATAIPGFLDTDHHEAAKNIELGPQATSIESPEFRARLAAARRAEVRPRTPQLGR